VQAWSWRRAWGRENRQSTRPLPCSGSPSSTPGPWSIEPGRRTASTLLHLASWTLRVNLLSQLLFYAQDGFLLRKPILTQDHRLQIQICVKMSNLRKLNI
jgi:hypothetical protein